MCWYKVSGPKIISGAKNPVLLELNFLVSTCFTKQTIFWPQVSVTNATFMKVQKGFYNTKDELPSDINSSPGWVGLEILKKIWTTNFCEEINASMSVNVICTVDYVRMPKFVEKPEDFNANSFLLIFAQHIVFL